MGNEGMSSEEIDKLTTEEEETPPVEEEAPPVEEPDEKTPETPDEEAPAEEKPDEETPPEEPEKPEETPEVDPKDAVIGDFRRKLRTSEIETARLQGQLQAQQAGPPEKSPLELAAIEQEKPLDEVIIDGKLYKEQVAWEQKQATARTQQQAAQDYQSGSEAASLAMTDEILGEGLGVEALGKLGEHLLTDTDHREIFMAGKNCGTVLYKALKKRILEAGGVAAQELQKRLKPTTKPKEEPKPKPKPKPKGPVPKDEGDESEVRASTSAIMKDLEM